MTISTVAAPVLPRWRIWLAENWLVLAWFAFLIAMTATTARTAPQALRQSRDLVDIPAQDRESFRQALSDLHLSSRDIAWFSGFTAVVEAIVSAAVGWLLIRRTPRTWFISFLAFWFIASATYPPDIDGMAPGQPVTQFIMRIGTIISIGGLFSLPFIFPDGRFVPRWTIIWGIYNTVAVIVFAFFSDSLPSGQIWSIREAATTILTIISIVYSVIYRYRKISNSDQRRQQRWVMFGLMVAVPGFFAGDAMMRNIGASTIGIVCLFGFLVIMPLTTMIPTITIAIAILHHRLFDIDLILGRTLVWLTMTAAVIGTYIGVVIGIGALIDVKRSLVLSLLATGLVALGFQPLMQRVRRLVDRFIYGDRNDPYAALARLGHHIQESMSSSDLLPQIVRTTADALRLPYAALFFDRAGEQVLAAASGAPTPSTLRLPLTYQGQSVGTLEVATRAPGEVFGQADRRLLEDLARQVGVAARAVSLATDLQHSREQIVTSREEERRRLRRDLHDGLGAQLAALMMQVGAARKLVRSDPDAADRELVELRKELGSAVVDIRRLVFGLRPPALDDLGLVGALRTRLARLDGGGIDADSSALEVHFEAEEPLPSLSAAAEVAAFRIIEEAVTNVVKHAKATRVDVSIKLRTGSLIVNVTDNGVGLNEPTAGTGLGIQSMRERATELGGTFEVTVGSDGRGSVVLVSLPNARADGS